jgi:hypothetical protein
VRSAAQRVINALWDNEANTSHVALGNTRKLLLALYAALNYDNLDAGRAKPATEK